MKILILRLSSLGDIVLTQPIAAWLRARNPQAQIDFVVKPQFEELVTLMGCGLNPIIYEKSVKAHLALFNSRYDIVIDLHAKLSTFLLRIAARGKQSFGYHKARSIRKRIVGGDRHLRISSTLDLYKTALEKIEPRVKLEAPRLYPPSQPDIPALPSAEKRIALFPGATHNTKRYPAEYYKELIKGSPNSYQYIILGAPSEAALCQSLSIDTEAINLCARLSFAQLMSLLETCDWVISSDSGPMHLAAALQKPQIAIFGATHPRLGFAPQNPNAHILCADLDCQPCSLHGAAKCPLGHFKCMHSISVRSIQEILSDL
jgi:heptosyltransferase-2